MRAVTSLVPPAPYSHRMTSSQPEPLTAARAAGAAPPREGPTWRSVPQLAAALALGIGGLYLLRILIAPIAYLVLAITIGEALAPLVERLQRRLPRGLAIGVVYACLAVVVGLLGWIVVPGLISQGQELAQRAPALIDQARDLAARVNRVIGGQVGSLASAGLGRLAGVLVALPLQILGVLLDMVLILFLSIYWLSGAPALQRFFLSLFPADRRPRAADVLGDMGQAMGGYVRGAAINAVIMGALAYVGLLAIGVDYAVVLGVLTMLGEPVPYIGPIIAAVPVVLVALLDSPTKALLAIALYTALQQLEGNVLTPYIMRRQTEVPGALVLFALLAGSAVGGLLGALVALPVAGAVRIFAVQVIAPAVRRRTGAVSLKGGDRER